MRHPKRRLLEVGYLGLCLALLVLGSGTTSFYLFALLSLPWSVPIVSALTFGWGGLVNEQSDALVMAVLMLGPIANVITAELLLRRRPASLDGV